jgi:lysozyme family protein
MPGVSLTDGLRAEYEQLFNSCVIRAAKAAEVETLVGGLAGHKARYEAVANTQGVPWWFVAVTHNMESSQNFARHLHNGDPLTARTKQVPAGRPKTGAPPFTWEASAADALSMHGLSAATDWSLSGALYQLERYNGWGYRQFHPHVKSPYLWSGSNQYASGKYVKDGLWSDSAVSAQIGAAVLLRRMAEKGLFAFAGLQTPVAVTGPLVTKYAKTKPASPAVIAAATALQAWLSTFPGIFLKPDGWAGEKTSDAYKAVTGHHLPGDPRGD